MGCLEVQAGLRYTKTNGDTTNDGNYLRSYDDREPGLTFGPMMQSLGFVLACVGTCSRPPMHSGLDGRVFRGISKPQKLEDHNGKEATGARLMFSNFPTTNLLTHVELLQFG